MKNHNLNYRAKDYDVTTILNQKQPKNISMSSFFRAKKLKDWEKKINKFEFWRQKSVLPIGDPGSTTNTEVDAINAPSSAGCNNASARGSKALACAKGPLEVSLLFWVEGKSQIISSHSSLQTKMSHWKCTRLLSGNLNME